MSEDIYAKPDLTNKVRFNRGEKEERVVDIYVSRDSLSGTIYENPRVDGDTGTPPTVQDNARTVQQHPVTKGSEEKSPFRAAAVCLGLLCLLLLAGIIALGVHSSKIKTRWNAERDLLQRSYTEERGRLRMINDNLTIERNQFQTSYDNLTIERNQLQTSYNNLTKQGNKLLTICKTPETICTCLMQEIQEINELQETPFETVGHWQMFGSSCYYFSSERKAWNESRLDCQRRGADLVIINSRKEQDFVASFSLRAWIGLTDREDEGTWIWVDGTTPTGYNNWHSGKPDSNGATHGEDCAEIFKTEHTWNDRPCESANHWICEKRIVV